MADAGKKLSGVVLSVALFASFLIAPPAFGGNPPAGETVVWKVTKETDDGTEGTLRRAVTEAQKDTTKNHYICFASTVSEVRLDSANDHILIDKAVNLVIDGMVADFSSAPRATTIRMVQPL